MEYNGITYVDRQVLSQVWQCPVCLRNLVEVESDNPECENCGRIYKKKEDIWHFSPDVSDAEKEFIHSYDKIRFSEGWGSKNPEYYLRLPYMDITRRHPEIWKIRAGNWDLFIQKVLIPMEKGRQGPLQILDIGAGNGWASYRLAERGHKVFAIDIRDGDRDGLGACKYYPVSPVRVLADMNHLPFREGMADLILYNASLHYSSDYYQTLKEGFRVLVRDGRLVIIDTPWYSTDREGRRMLKENYRRYIHEYPPVSPVSSFQGYLTKDRMANLETRLLMKGSVYLARSTFADRLKRKWRKIRGLREPALFPVLSFRHDVSYTLPGEFMDSRLRKIPVLQSVYFSLLTIRQHYAERFRYNHEHFEQVNDRRFLVTRWVFPPRLMRSGAWMAEVLAGSPGMVPHGGKLLDLGTGSGVLAITASPIAGEVIGVDNNPDAVSCARRNALRLHCTNVRFVEGDLFEPFKDERFDCVLCNPPYFKGRPADRLDGAWRSESFLIRMADELRDHLNQQGYALMVLSDHGESEWLLDRLWQAGYGIEAVVHRDYVNEVLVLYKIYGDRS
ncbi:MAG TPA: methyltransferase domain-containing protein [Balneolales bacterium]|nr:methyltransferase domain-containing protein [Balneolales bacterium]